MSNKDGYNGVPVGTGQPEWFIDANGCPQVYTLQPYNGYLPQTGIVYQNGYPVQYQNGYPYQSSYPVQGAYPYQNGYSAQSGYIYMNGYPYQSGAVYQNNPQPQSNPQPKPAPAPVNKSVEPKRPVAASQAERVALVRSESCAWMLIACILCTVSVLLTLLYDVFALNVLGLFPLIIDVLVLTGLWLTFANGKRRILSSAGIKLVKFPFTIAFVFNVIKFAFVIYVWIYMMNVLNLFLSVLSFVFYCACFASIYRVLGIAGEINRNRSAGGRFAGAFAGVCLIVYAMLSLASALAQYFGLDVILSSLNELGVPYISGVMGLGGLLTLVMAAVAFLANVCLGAALITFDKKLKRVRDNS